MGDSDNRSGEGGAVPTWARFLETGRFQALVDLVTAELERRGIPFHFDVEQGLVHLPKPESEAAALGLLNLAQICHQSPFHTWPSIVAQHVGRSLDLADETDDAIERLAADFDQARTRLKVRLYPADVGSEIFLTVREPMDGVKAVLVYDMPETIHSVRQGHVDGWGRPLEELFAIALDNVKASEPVEPKTFPIDQNAALTLLGGESYFTASHALFLGDYLDPIPEHGALVSVPHRHVVIYHPIVDQGVLLALNAMIPMTLGMFQDGPGSISPQLYWWRGGRFLLLPTEVGNSEIKFTPPDEFVALLNRVVS
jgi:hypothetical protein